MLKLIFALSALTIFSVANGTCQAENARRPNIVFILADDLGYGDVQCFGKSKCKIATPNFDRLASEGIRFTDAYANASVCVPTRVAIMTGTYPWRLPKPSKAGPWGYLGAQFSTQQHTLGKMLQAAGYHTGYVGKWHLGTVMQTKDGKTQSPDNVDYSKPLSVGASDHGFDESFILPGSLDMYPYAFVRNNRWVGKVTAKKGWSAFNRVGPAEVDFEDTKVLDTFTSEAERFIGSAMATRSDDNGKPFFLYLALTAPHTPVSPSSTFRNQSGLGIYGDFVMETDHCVGRILDALDKHKIANDTLVVATSDHGPAAYAGVIAKATYGQNRLMQDAGHFSNGPFRGYKFSVYEGGLRVPMVARWPAVSPVNSSCDRIVGLPDMMATFADVAGIQLRDEEALDSSSLLPLLKDPSAEPVRESILLSGTHGMCIRSGAEKLCLCPGSGSLGRYGNHPKTQNAWEQALKSYGKTPTNHDELARAPFVQLFNVTSDRHEDRNLASESPDRVKYLYEMAKEQISSGRTRPGKFSAKARDVKAIQAPGFVWKSRKVNSDVSIVHEPGRGITATCDGKPILKYNIATKEPPHPIEKLFRRSGYIHPVFTPSGKEVTGDFAQDHPHQHALFNAWTNTTFQGHDVDFWNQRKQQGRVAHDKVIEVGDDFFTVQLRHEDITDAKKPVTVLLETWTIRVLGKVDGANVFDITSKQTCVAQAPLRINEYHYGGMGIRCHNSWATKEGASALKRFQKAGAQQESMTMPPMELTRHRFMTSEGKGRLDGNHTRPLWVNLSGLVDDELAGVTVMGHRTNFRFPQPVRLHPSKPYFCFAPMVIGEFSIHPREEYVSKFRYVVHDGEMKRPRVNRQWKEFQAK